MNTSIYQAPLITSSVLRLGIHHHKTHSPKFLASEPQKKRTSWSVSSRTAFAWHPGIYPAYPCDLPVQSAQFFLLDFVESATTCLSTSSSASGALVPQTSLSLRLAWSPSVTAGQGASCVLWVSPRHTRVFAILKLLSVLYPSKRNSTRFSRNQHLWMHVGGSEQEDLNSFTPFSVN